MVEGTYNRKLAAILNADVKGYSRLMGDDEAATVATIKEYLKVFASQIEAHNGRLLDATGDNLLAEFPSVVYAVQCGVQIQRKLENKNAELPNHRMMQFRIGINLGDVIEEEGTIFGDGVNICSRVQGLADPGGISISGTAYDQIQDKLDLETEFIGEHAVKNIKSPVRIYKLLLNPNTETILRDGESPYRGLESFREMDEVGVPQIINPYPKFSGALALARNRWQTQREYIWKQVIRGTIGGGLSLAFYGCFLPAFTVLADPVEFNKNLEFISLPAWVLSGAIIGGLWGSVQGAAITAAVYIADALFMGKHRNIWRFVLGGFAGLVYSIILILFSVSGLLTPFVDVGVFVPVFLVYGLFLGMTLSNIIPPIGFSIEIRRQLTHALQTIIVLALIAIPVISIVYKDIRGPRILQELFFVTLFTLGLAFAMVKRTKQGKKPK